MGLWDRIKRIFSSNLNSLLDSAEDPEKMLDQVIRDMSEQLKTTKKHVASAIASQKKLERDYQNEVNAANNYLAKAKAILNDGDESNDHLAKEALQRKKHHETLADQIKVTHDQQKAMVEKLKGNLRKLEQKVRESEAKKNSLKAKHATAKTQKQIAEQMANLDDNSSFEAFERLEAKINHIEDSAVAQLELNSESVTNQLEDVSFDAGVEQEFLALKGESQHIEDKSTKSSGGASASMDTDDEFEKLKAELKK